MRHKRTSGPTRITARITTLLMAGILATSAGAPSAAARTADIALTFDDLPALTQIDDQAYANTLTTRLLRGLVRHHLPAIGFVNEGKLDELDRRAQIAILRQWLRAGMDLGNHTFSHESPNTLGADGYIADIAKGEPVTKRLLASYGKQMRWFRHPYLETGSPAATRQRIDAWLTAHHYRVAPVTMEAADWMFSEPYDHAVTLGDKAGQDHIKAAYLAYTDRMIRWHQSAAQAVFGRQISYVMLLHATRLNADSIDDFAALLRHRGLHAVTLDRAMQDPAYRTVDTYAGTDGLDWLERWAEQLHKELPWDDYVDPPADIQAAYDKIDSDRENQNR